MDDIFNPYTAWLGISDANGTPDHYTLLGLPAFEKDSRQITSACDGMMARVRGHRPGAHLKQWQQLLDELTAAKACLLDPYKREEYDTELRRANGSSSSIAPTTKPTSTQGSSQPGTYMWPPGFEPPGYKPAGDNAESKAAEKQGSLPPGAVTNPTPATQSAKPLDVPVLSPSGNSTAPTVSSAPPSAVPTAVPTASPVGTPTPTAVPTASPIASPSAGAPVAQPYVPTAAPVSNQVPVVQPVSQPYYPQPPIAPYGATGQGADPMAPVSSQGTAPVAQPYGQSQPVAPYGQSTPTAQPVYAQPAYGQSGPYPVQAMPVGGVPTAMPVQNPGGMQTPQAVPVGVQTGQAQPVRAVSVSAVSANAEPDLGLRVPTKSTAKAYKQARKKSSVPMVIAAMMAASILVIVAVMIFLRDGTFVAEKNQPRSAREMPMPEQQPITVIREVEPDTGSLLSPLGADDPTPPPQKKRPGSTIGPLVKEAGQTPETMPLIDPETKPESKPESAIPEMKKPEPMPETKEPPTPTATPEEVAAVRKTLGQAIVAMGYRDWDTSDAMLEKAKQQASDEMLKEKVEAVKFLSDNVKEFWKGVKESAAQLSAGQELVLGNSRVAVVESNATTLIIRLNGNNRRYPVGDLPMGLARTLAATWFDVNAPSTKVFTGSFLLVEPNGDKEEAGQLWQAARQGGVNMDLLMPLLDDDLRAAAAENDAT